jgi:hypothetical protein
MLPRRESWTSLNKPFDKADMATINSVALPKVALRRPPTESFVWIANCSVTKPNRSAIGASAKREKINVTPDGQPDPQEINATGRHISKIFNGPVKNLFEFRKIKNIQIHHHKTYIAFVPLRKEYCFGC